MNYLILADFGAATVIISFGAIMGKCNLFQLWIFATIEVVFYTLNEAISTQIFGVKDIGGSMLIHTFGAYFGIAGSFFFQNVKALEDKEGRYTFNYYSAGIAMIGTTFLYLYWPSFNAALGVFGSQMHRAIINTLLASSTSVLSAVLFSRICTNHLDMVVLINATLAGGAGIAGSADLISKPYGSMIVGFVVGAVATIGFTWAQPFIRNTLKIHDT